MERRIEEFDYTTSKRGGYTRRKGHKVLAIQNPSWQPRSEERSRNLFYLILGAVVGVIVHAGLLSL